MDGTIGRMVSRPVTGTARAVTDVVRYTVDGTSEFRQLRCALDIYRQYARTRISYGRYAQTTPPFRRSSELDSVTVARCARGYQMTVLQTTRG